jgi:3-phosphoglycerate kinase
MNVIKHTIRVGCQLVKHVNINQMSRIMQTFQAAQQAIPPDVAVRRQGRGDFERQSQRECELGLSVRRG